MATKLLRLIEYISPFGKKKTQWWAAGIIPAFALFAVASCNRVEPEAPAHLKLDSALTLPVSELSVPVYYPVQDLEDMVNEKLGAKIIEANVANNDKEDSLMLTVSRFKPVTISYDGDRGIQYTVPI